jgi:hypothetical protein
MTITQLIRTLALTTSTSSRAVHLTSVLISGTQTCFAARLYLLPELITFAEVYDDQRVTALCPERGTLLSFDGAPHLLAVYRCWTRYAVNGFMQSDLIVRD